MLCCFRVREVPVFDEKRGGNAKATLGVTQLDELAYVSFVEFSYRTTIHVPNANIYDKDSSDTFGVKNFHEEVAKCVY